MLSGKLPVHLAAALAGASMLAAASSAASAFTLPGPSLAQPSAQAQIQRVWWDRWGRWHPDRYAYGYGPFGVVGALGAAAVGTADAIGGAVAGPGPCWRRYYGPYGWHWRRVC
ncbi:MAG: hypothetical protein ABR970_09410 [Roseiarcus sp.]|jgi:hypothetical protein